MASKLKNLRVRKVDFVDEGANPDADIKMKKRKEQEIGKNSENNTGFWKRLIGFIGSAAGMDQNEIDNAVEEIRKGDSVSFKEKINEVNNRKIADEIWDICYALQSSLCSILNDEELDSTGAAAAMQESLDEFYAVVQESAAKWSSGRAASIVRKNEEISEADLEVMKSAVERLNETIAKAGKTPDGEQEADDNKKEEGDKEEMGVKIDKSKLTDAEKAFLESIEKRCGAEGDADVPGQGGTEGAAPNPGTQAGTTEEPVNKVKEGKPGKEQAAVPGDGDDIYKGMHPAVKAELEALKKFRENAEEAEIRRVAKKYTIIGKKEEDLVPLLKSLKGAGGTAYNDMLAVLDQAVEAVEKSGMFSEIGKSGHGGAEGGGAWAEADARAVELMKSKTGLSKSQALDEVFQGDPELAKRCEKED